MKLSPEERHSSWHSTCSLYGRVHCTNSA